MKIKLLIYIMASFFAVTVVNAELVPEFVSLTQKANIEKGKLEWKSNTFLIEKITQALGRDVNTGRQSIVLEIILDEKLSIVMGTQDEILPDGSFAVINDSGTSYVAKQLSASEESSQVIMDHHIIVFTGNFEGNDESFPATITITESIVGGGSSEIRIEEDEAYLNGGLGTRTYNQIFDLITEHPEVSTIVEVDVPGSINDAINMQTGRLIRQAGIDTFVPGNGSIASGGVDLFCAGVNRTIEHGAKLGVHSWSGDGIQASDLPEDSPLHNDQIEYFNEMLGSPLGKDFYFFTINAAPADGMHIMSEEEIIRWQLGTLTGTPNPPKRFSFECDKEVTEGLLGIETLTLNVGETASCILKLAGGNGKDQGITNFIRGNGDTISIVSDGETEDGELLVEIEGRETGMVWASWGIINPDSKKRGLFNRFNKLDFDQTNAWGFIVEVVDE